MLDASDFSDATISGANFKQIKMNGAILNGVASNLELEVAKLYNMLPADEPGSSEGRTALNNATTIFLDTKSKYPTVSFCTISSAAEINGKELSCSLNI